jgi:hypothetical protein
MKATVSNPASPRYRLPLLPRFIEWVLARRVDVLIVLATWATLTQLESWLNDDLALALVVAIWIALLAHPRSRRWLRFQRIQQAVFRKWRRAMRMSGLANAWGAVPTPRRWQLTRVPPGLAMDVVVPAGIDVPAMASKGEAIAAVFRIRDVRITRHAADAGRASVVLAYRDPLADRGPIPWLHARVPYDGRVVQTAEGIKRVLPPDGDDYIDAPIGIPIGLGEDGDVAFVHLPERHLLVGGASGGGKTSCLSLLAASVALTPPERAQLYVIDTKLVFARRWEPVAQATAQDEKQAISLLEGVAREMDARYELLAEHGLEGLAEWDAERDGPRPPRKIVIADELADLTAAYDRAERDDLNRLLHSLLRKGRAAGISLVAGVQRPSHRVISPDLRDLFQIRIAFRTSTTDMSEMILGDWASHGYSAAQLPNVAGMALLGGDGSGPPLRIRTAFLPGDGIQAIIARALRGRAGEPPAEDDPRPVAVHGEPVAVA